MVDNGDDENSKIICKIGLFYPEDFDVDEGEVKKILDAARREVLSKIICLARR